MVKIRFSKYRQIKITRHEISTRLGLVSIAAVGESQIDYRDLPNLLFSWSGRAARQFNLTIPRHEMKPRRHLTGKR